MGKGYYTKHFNIGKEAILSFDANCKTKDNHFEAGKLCNTNGFQVVEDRKDHPDYDFTYNVTREDLTLSIKETTEFVNIIEDYLKSI